MDENDIPKNPHEFLKRRGIQMIEDAKRQRAAGIEFRRRLTEELGWRPVGSRVTDHV